MVDLNAFALLRAVVRGELAERTVAIVDIGARVTNVVIAAQGVPRLVRMIPSGGQNVTDAVARALSVPASDAEGIKREIGVGFSAPASREAAAEAIAEVAQRSSRRCATRSSTTRPTPRAAGSTSPCVTGGGAHLPGLGQYLSSASRLPVVLGDPLAG